MIKIQGNIKFFTTRGINIDSIDGCPLTQKDKCVGFIESHDEEYFYGFLFDNCISSIEFNGKGSIISMEILNDGYFHD